MVKPSNPHSFTVQGQTAAVANSLGEPGGRLRLQLRRAVLDLPHNSFLEVGARTHTFRVYEMC